MSQTTLSRILNSGWVAACALVVSAVISGCSDEGPEMSYSLPLEQGDKRLMAAAMKLDEVQDKARAEGMPKAEVVGGFKGATFHPKLGVWKKLIEFEFLTAQSMRDGGRHDWTISLTANDLRVREMSCLPPENPQATPYVARHTKDWAIQQAENFCGILRPDGLAGLRLVQAEFVQSQNHSFKETPFMNGFWRIGYQRFSTGGYPVDRDWLSMMIDEDFGIRSYNDKCATQVNEDTLGEDQIGEEYARKRGLKFAQKWMRKGSGRVLNEIPLDAWLVIARPNQILTRGISARESDKGRLVWEVRFRLDGKGPVRGGVYLQPMALSIYIDAKDGRCVGGSF